MMERVDVTKITNHKRSHDRSGLFKQQMDEASNVRQ